jgi:hypothetical protein
VNEILGTCINIDHVPSVTVSTNGGNDLRHSVYSDRCYANILAKFKSHWQEAPRWIRLHTFLQVVVKTLVTKVTESLGVSPFLTPGLWPAKRIPFIGVLSPGAIWDLRPVSGRHARVRAWHDDDDGQGTQVSGRFNCHQFTLLGQRSKLHTLWEFCRA